MTERHGNWIDGEWLPARRGFAFTVESALLSAPRERLEWPRSGAEEAKHALTAAAAAQADWKALGRSARESYLRRMCQDLTTEQDLDLAELLDLEDADLCAHTERLTSLFEDGSLADRADEMGDSVLWLARSDWRQLFLGFETSLAALLAGSAVVLLSDARVPQLARAFARAAESADLPRGVLAVLHDDGLTSLRAALLSDQVTDVYASGDLDSLVELEQVVRRSQRAADSVALTARIGFGAGVEVEGAEPLVLPRFESREIRSTATVVRVAEGAQVAAERVLEESLGRFSALDGVLDGRVGIALCPERLFASFSAELLAQLEGLELPLEGPLALDQGLDRELGQARERGLDEGATLILDGLGGGRGSGGSLPGSPGAILLPTIFTNVEEHMQLVRSSRPGPLLCLMRVASEEAGDELAGQLDAITRA